MWRELLKAAGEQPARLYEGVIASDAETVNDKVTVVLGAFDMEQTFGPAPWMPRVSDGGAPVLPARGDRALVALGETDDPGEPEVWIIAWWPYD